MLDGTASMAARCRWPGHIVRAARRHRDGQASAPGQGGEPHRAATHSATALPRGLLAAAGQATCCSSCGAMAQAPARAGRALGRRVLAAPCGDAVARTARRHCLVGCYMLLVVRRNGTGPGASGSGAGQARAR